jgi:hypothetical protein
LRRPTGLPILDRKKICREIIFLENIMLAFFFNSLPRMFREIPRKFSSVYTSKAKIRMMTAV